MTPFLRLRFCIERLTWVPPSPPLVANQLKRKWPTFVHIRFVSTSQWPSVSSLKIRTTARSSAWYGTPCQNLITRRAHTWRIVSVFNRKLGTHAWACRQKLQTLVVSMPVSIARSQVTLNHYLRLRTTISFYFVRGNVMWWGISSRLPGILFAILLAEAFLSIRYCLKCSSSRAVLF